MSSRTPLTPYYHPTTACLIDDNESFMSGLSVVMPTHMSSVAFFNPMDALEYVNRPQELPSLADRCFSAHQRSPRPMFQLDTGLIEQEINIVRRFNRLSVVIVDYSMPAIDGMEFCNRINDPHVGKVLLTGVADEKMAVEAFNEGIIDRFIAKSHPEASERISAYALDMQDAYFRAQTGQVQRTLSLAGPVFLDDPSVAHWVRRLMRRKNFCEHYMVSQPPGLLLLTPAGDISQLVIVSGEECDQQADHAERHGAPEAVVRRLRKRSHVGFFLDDPAGYLHPETQDDEYPWQELITRSTRLGSSDHYWYAALFSAPPQNIDYHPGNACLHAWEAQRDSFRPKKASVLI